MDWLTTKPLGDAVWERAMFANPTTVCKLRDKFTLDTLAQRFGLEE